jgi:3-methyladenine DNA glycosylase/8-oxoguanine DNA glycosylase
MTETNLRLLPPSPFSLEATLTSHGWIDLLPNAWDATRRALRRTERLSNGLVVLFEVYRPEVDNGLEIAIRVTHEGELGFNEKEELSRKVSHMLRLDEDFSEFYALCQRRGGRWTRLSSGLGRILRSPTVFEDAVKTICTTNVQWGGTKGMLRRLVEAYGDPFLLDSGLRSFPLPEAIVATSLDSFANTVRMGYRAPYIHLLAQHVASGELDLQTFLDPACSTTELRKKLLDIKGVGNYAAATLLMLLGRYDDLAVDSAFRQVVSRVYFDGQYPSDKEAQAVYQDFGQWKYLAYWFDIWEYFHS